MPTKKQYVLGRDHYAVYRRELYKDQYEIEYLCKTSKEEDAWVIALAMSDLHAHPSDDSNVDFVVRALPTKEHTIAKRSTMDARKKKETSVYIQEQAVKRRIKDQILATNPNGRISIKKVLELVEPRF